jgi:hypothetical protein
MIDIKAFRIGNALLVDGVPQTLRAISVNNNDPSAASMAGYLLEEVICYVPVTSDRIQPVLLADEVLECYGFVFDNYFKLWQKKRPGIGTGSEIELDRDYTVLDFGYRPVVKEVKHLHTLQNLYYALQGKELQPGLVENQPIEAVAA